MKFKRYFNKGRLNKIFEAIDEGDSNLYFTDKEKWLRKHGYTGYSTVKDKSIYIKVRD